MMPTPSLSQTHGFASLDRRLARCAAIGFALAVGGAPAAAQPAKDAPCPTAPSATAIVAAVGADLDITLADGRVLAVSGVEPPRATPDAPRRAQDVRDALTARLAGRSLAWAPLGPPDRWSRYPAAIFAPGDLAADLLQQGLVRWRPDRVASPCRAALIAAEDSARRAGRGVWADPALGPVRVDDQFDRDALPAAAEDGMVVVEGVVAGVGETPARLYLNLGRARGGFALSVSKRDKALMESGAFSQARIVGARLRARGLLDRRFGPQIELNGPDALEIVTPAAPDAPKP